MHLPEGASTSTLFPPGHVIDVRLTDFDKLREHALGWRIEIVQQGSGPLRGTLRVLHTARLQFAALEVNIAYTGSGKVPDGTWTADVIAVEPGIAVRSSGVDFGPLEFYVSNDRHPFDVTFGGPNRQLLLSAHEALIESFAGPLWRRPLPAGDRMRFESPLRRSRFEREALRWLRLASETPALLSDLRFAKTLEVRIIETLLCGAAPSAPPAAPAMRHAVARKAREYVLERLEEPLSLADLCARFEVSERTLLQGFAEIYGMGPIAYARQSRLDAAHRDLRTGRGSVTDVAAKWGFFHFGRFSQQYRDAFGYRPSQTPADTFHTTQQ